MTCYCRCALVAYILSENQDSSRDNDEDDGPILSYLKSITPPAIDAEMRSLCLHERDDDGIKYLHMLLLWFKKKLSSGTNFEVLQAYLHRLLAIYSEVIIATSASSSVDLRLAVQELQKVHEDITFKFRHLIQKNLCLMKVFANLPIL